MRFAMDRRSPTFCMHVLLESMSTELVASNIRLYAERLRHNMAFEELVLFPAASKWLDDDDWQAVEPSAQRDASDPLFHSHVQERFADLHRAIAAESGCGCDARQP